MAYSVPVSSTNSARRTQSRGDSNAVSRRRIRSRADQDHASAPLAPIAFVLIFVTNLSVPLPHPSRRSLITQGLRPHTVPGDADVYRADADADVFGKFASSTDSFHFPASSPHISLLRTSSEQGHLKDGRMALHKRTPMSSDRRSNALSSPPFIQPSSPRTYPRSSSGTPLASSLRFSTRSPYPPSSLSCLSSLVPGPAVSPPSPTSLSVSPPNFAPSSSRFPS
ncbi:hypothetical protein BDN72DRAFT_92883 [Pluteus cervinus]|uniref:Uncharacterized protein n=1 Tax=Pluteus cervinus TaxID=181527 RepID=A0ACD3ARI8_9AGAR|nr:hypothetical protein BDN72DRAFT_92883 [Pluteus cervinus]